MGMEISPLIIVVAILALASAIGLVWKRRNGAVRMITDSADRISAEEVGQPLGASATLVQFSSAFCQPCRATRRILEEVSEMVPGVAHIEIDAEQNLELVRRLNVLRTPTVFVLDARGMVRTRSSGQPRKVDVIAALGEVVAP